MTGAEARGREPLALWTETLERLLRLRTGGTPPAGAAAAEAGPPAAKVWIAPPHLPELLTRRGLVAMRDTPDQAA